MKNTSDSSSYDLLPLLLNNLGGMVIKSIKGEQKAEFPKKVANYTFYKVLPKRGPRRSYQLALYKGPGSKLAVCKMRSARIKGYHYYSLKNEIKMYELLNGAQNRIGTKMPRELKKFYIPKLVAKQENADYVLALIEYVRGKLADDLSTKKQLEVYFGMAEFLEFLGSKLTQEERQMVSQRRAAHFVLLYPFLLARAVVNNPKAAGRLIRGTPIFLRALPNIASGKNFKLAHRDLHFLNIIVDKNRISLVDLQQCVYTDVLHEYVTTLRYYWKEKREFYPLFFGEIIKRASKRDNFQNVLKGLMVNSATHGLTGTGFSKTVVNHWIDFLGFAVEPDFGRFSK